MSRALPPHWPQSGEVAQKIYQIASDAAPRKPSTRLGRKGFLYLQKAAPKAVKPEERVKITARRISKAERDERMDVTHALTPVKQYMAGFTRPSDLRSSNWFPGGAYVSRGKIYESPVEEAYHSYTVYVLESRYNIRYGVGRVDAPDYVYGMCREQDLPGVLRTYNSTDAPRSVLEAMDNARWPKGPQARPHQQQKWWIDKADLQLTLQEIGSAHFPDPDLVEEDDEDDEVKPMKVKKPKQRKSKTILKRVTDLSPIPSLSNPTIKSPGDSASSARAFHSSSILLAGRNHNDDHIVPDFYVQHKQAKADKENEETASKASGREKLQDSFFLMDHLSEGILSDEIVASTRRQASKIPPEFDTDGVLVHPSGFVIPTPSQSTSSGRRQQDRDLAQQTAAVAERVSEEDLTDVKAETSSRKGKVPYEVRREDGTVSHPSGFEPPTAADAFKHSGNSTVDSPIGQQPSVLSSDSPGAKRGFHTTASVRAEEVEWDFERAMAQDPNAAKFITREEYIPTLEDTPFWRPLVTLTVSTRPIAATLLRLSRGGPTGRPFHADIDNHDKKCRISFIHRMRAMRLRRIQDLTLEMGQVLSGLRGGIIGIRFDTDSLGRGIGGEALANPIPHEKRVIGVGIGNWYRLAPEMKELFRTRAEEEIPAQKPLDIFGLDDFGHKISEETGEVIPWKRCPETHAERLQREPWYTEARTLRHALRTFTRYHQVMQIINTGGKPKVAASKPPKKLPTVLQAPADKEEEDEELELSDEEDDADASSFSLSRPPPVYSVRMQEDALEQLKQLSHDLIDEEEEFISFSEEEPPNFVLCHPDGTPLLGPRDENGEISLENMREVSVNLARTAVQRRFDLLCIAKRQELATIIASRGTRVDIPGRIVNK